MSEQLVRRPGNPSQLRAGKAKEPEPARLFGRQTHSARGTGTLPPCSGCRNGWAFTASSWIGKKRAGSTRPPPMCCPGASVWLRQGSSGRHGAVGAAVLSPVHSTAPSPAASPAPSLAPSPAPSSASSSAPSPVLNFASSSAPSPAPSFPSSSVLSLAPSPASSPASTPLLSPTLSPASSPAPSPAPNPALSRAPTPAPSPVPRCLAGPPPHTAFHHVSLG